MREILFRAKSTDNNKWIYGGFCENTAQYSLITHLHMDRGVDVEMVHRETLGQFTGLLDADDKKIFEGDVIESNRNTRHVISYCEEEACFVAQFVPQDKRHPHCKINKAWIDKYSKKVIGNIHEKRFKTF